MLVPLKWLRQFVDYNVADQDLADLLSLSGLEVEGLQRRHQGLELVLAAKVLRVEPHPNADRLHLVTVDDGRAEHVVVCGAPGVAPGQIVPLALEGAVLGELTIKRARIRGVESRGMLCSERDLGLSDDHGGLLNLDPTTPLGAPLTEALGLETAVMEISITPNRGDALGVLGVAREVGALLNLPVRDIDCAPPEDDQPVAALASVEIQAPDACRRYVARMVRGAVVGPSPLWLRDRLAACGVRPINNLVDVTNYVMMERGQPLHAFDHARLAGGRIVVRQAVADEPFTTLDGQQRKLQEGMLLICDAEKPVALAGVMGGQNSEIEAHTSDVLIESAFFEPGGIRRTAKALGMGSESSYRFERGVDLEGCAKAADRAAQLMAMLAGGRVCAGRVDAYPRPYQAPAIAVSAARTSALLGLSLDVAAIKRPLEALGLSVESSGDDSLTAWPPAARTDLERPVDLIEEVARIIGYDKIPVSTPRGVIGGKPRAREQLVRERLRDLMTAQGFDEAINYSFGHPDWPDKLRLAADDPRRGAVAMQNPLVEDQSALRTSLLPGLLGCVRRNLGHRVADVALFEVGKTFIARPDNPQPHEPMRLGAVLCGLAQPVSWFAGEAEVSFTHIRGAVEYLLEAMGLADPRFAQDGPPPPYLEAGQWLAVLVGQRRLGEIGLVAAQVAAEFEIKKPVYCLDLDVDLLVQLTPERGRFRHLPRFPEVMRDVALVVDETVAAGEVLAEARAWGGKLLREARLFDVYKGKPLDKRQKSLGLRLTYRADDRTLTEEEIVPDFEAMVGRLVERFKAALRA